MVFITKPPKSVIKGKYYKGSVMKKHLSGFKTKTVKKWTFKKQITKVGKNGTCGRGRLDYNINPHTSVGIYGDGCIGNPLSSNPIPTTLDSGGVVLDVHF